MAADPELEIVAFEVMHLRDVEDVVRNERSAYAFPWAGSIFVDCMAAGHECWIARCRGEVIGHAVLSVAAREAHLLNICIGLDAQRQGHGRALAEHMIARAIGRRAHVMFLEVRPSNEIACRLYASLGFDEVGLRKRYYPAANGREDAKILALRLDTGDA